MIDIYILGKRYQVPSTLTIQDALEYAGYQLIRGVGCRSGFCGACGTVYRVQGDPKLKFALACQTVVEPNMYLAQIPFFPAEKAIYDIAELEPTIMPLKSPSGISNISLHPIGQDAHAILLFLIFL